MPVFITQEQCCCVPLSSNQTHHHPNTTPIFTLLLRLKTSFMTYNSFPSPLKHRGINTHLESRHFTHTKENQNQTMLEWKSRSPIPAQFTIATKSIQTRQLLAWGKRCVYKQKNKTLLIVIHFIVTLLLIINYFPQAITLQDEHILTPKTTSALLQKMKNQFLPLSQYFPVTH